MTAPIWIDVRDARTVHDRLLALHGGAAGLRNEGMLESALARPRQLYAYTTSTDIIEMAAAYAVGIIRNHPFVDGNKRTGFVVGILFLELERIPVQRHRRRRDSGGSPLGGRDA